MPGVLLNANGEAQAQAAARRLAGEGLVAIYASPLERAQQTAQAIAAEAGLPVQPAAEINEVDFGEWTGQDFEQLHAHPQWKPWNRDRSGHPPPGGETLGQAQARSLAWVREAARRHPRAAVAVVCHSDIVKALICAALDLDLDRHGRLEISPGSVSVLTAGEGPLRVRTINEVPR